MTLKFDVGDGVRKIGGDYDFEGRVVSGFLKLDRNLLTYSDQIRYVVQNADGLLHIFNEKQLQRLE